MEVLFTLTRKESAKKTKNSPNLPFFTTLHHYKMYKKGYTKKILVYFNTSTEKKISTSRGYQ